MKALSVLREARAAGIELDVVGEDVRLKADRKPPQKLVEALRQHKAEIIALLGEMAEPIEGRPALDDGDGWHQRLGSHRNRLAQLDYAADVASLLAHGHLLNDIHSALVAIKPPDPTVCAGCDQTLAGPALDTGDGARVHDQADHKCLVAYGRKWRKRASDQLAPLGIDVPATVVEIQ
jgi:hypothetical protein